MFYNKIKSCLTIVFLSPIIAVFLSNCVGNGNIGNSVHPSSGSLPTNTIPLTIDDAGLVPIINNSPTRSVIYIHNNSDKVITDISYTTIINNNNHKLALIKSNKKLLNQTLLINPNSANQCAVIAAHASCALGFITPKMATFASQGSSIISANYTYDGTTLNFSQIINYANINNDNINGVQIMSGDEVSGFGNKTAYTTLYVYGTGNNQHFKISSLNTSTPNTTIINHDITGLSLNSGIVDAIEISSQINNEQSYGVNINLQSENDNGVKFSSQATILIANPTTDPKVLIGLISVVDTYNGNVNNIYPINIINTASVNIENVNITATHGVVIKTQCANNKIAAGGLCIASFSVPQYAGNGMVSVNGTTTMLGAQVATPIATSSQAVIWFNSKSGALINMQKSVDPALLFSNNLNGVRVIINVNNIGGYDVSNLDISRLSVMKGQAKVSLVTDTVTDTCSGKTIKATNGACSYQIKIIDDKVESGIIYLYLTGKYQVYNSAIEDYSRVIILNYRSIANLTTSSNTWVSGESISDQAGIYGIKGVSNIQNIPGSRTSSISWVDLSGNLWLFGGYGYDKNGNGDNLNDLWKYSPSNNSWAWISGESLIDKPGIYGSKGATSVNYIPGSRVYSISWADKSGNLWLFGGLGFDKANRYGNLNDLWKYNQSNNTWTWVSGSNLINQVGVYGLKGVSSINNIAGNRMSAVSWIDQSGNLWLFGGLGYGKTATQGDLNDLWKYNPNDNTWTWVKGESTINQRGIYGTLGVAANINIPGAREDSISWRDQFGNLWLFGGFGFGESGNLGVLNDLWKYNPIDNTWTWVSGSRIPDKAGIYGPKGDSSTSYIPGARTNSISWTDKFGNLWLLGGDGFDKINYAETLNDLWMYNPLNNTWAWINGESIGGQIGVYGPKGATSVTYMPGGRFDSISWSDGLGNLWLFGGLGFSSGGNYRYLNDLWKLQPK